MTNALRSHSIQLTIPFHDVDAMGVVWHGNYFRYFENAREALLNTFDYSYRQMSESGYVWPIVETKVKYIVPLLFEQQITVHARLSEYENRLRIDYEITDSLTGKKTTKAYTIQVAVDKTTEELCFVTPDIFLEKLGV